MDVVIKGTKTIEEFKQVKASMEERAERYSRRHIASCEHWQDGYPVKCWRGGNCWQYTETANGLEWF